MTAPRLVLASASPARLNTLRQAGIDPVVQVSAVDEDAELIRTGTTDAEQVPLVLAKAKAEDVARTPGPAAGAIVLGCDSVLDLDGVALGKPDDAADAVSRWRRLRGRSGRAADRALDRRPAPGRGRRHRPVVRCRLGHHGALRRRDRGRDRGLRRTGEPLLVAGAFTVDGLGGAFVTAIEGDYHGVVGVSLPLLRDLFGRLGLTWTDLWTDPPLSH